MNSLCEKCVNNGCPGNRISDNKFCMKCKKKTLIKGDSLCYVCATLLKKCLICGSSIVVVEKEQYNINDTILDEFEKEQYNINDNITILEEFEIMEKPSSNIIIVPMYISVSEICNNIKKNFVKIYNDTYISIYQWIMIKYYTGKWI